MTCSLLRYLPAHECSDENSSAAKDKRLRQELSLRWLAGRQGIGERARMLADHSKASSRRRILRQRSRDSMQCRWQGLMSICICRAHARVVSISEQDHTGHTGCW